MTSGAILPAILVLSLSLATLTQLQDIAQRSADKSIKYAEDSNKAIDCAFQARPLSDCSPDLFSTDFKQEVQDSQKILDDLKSQQMGANLQH